MDQTAIMRRHPAIFEKPAPNKYGRCHCGMILVREYAGPDTYYICCPESHSNPGHVCFIDEGETND